MASRDERIMMQQRSRRSPPAVMAHAAGPYAPRQGGTTLPPLNTAFAPQFTEPIYEPPPRMSPGRNEVFSPSYAQGHWPNSGHMMAGHQHFSYSPIEYDRNPSPPVPPLYQRQSPGLPSDPSSMRRLPPLSIPPSREEIWTTDHNHIPGFPPSFSLQPMPDAGMQSPNSYPGTYDASYHLHPSSPYQPLHPPSLETRHMNHPMHFPGEGHPPPPHRNAHPAEWPSSSARADSHLVSPYARRDMMGHSPQEPSPVDYPQVKKKRKRADAQQLKILNEVYARTAFPTTEERLELARKLDMSARSVQIWFQNKRQSTRQSRTGSGALPPIIHHPYQAQQAQAQPPPPPPPPRVGPSPRPEIPVSGHVPMGSRSPGSSSQRAIHNASPRPPHPDVCRRERSPEANGVRVRRPPY